MRKKGEGGKHIGQNGFGELAQPMATLQKHHHSSSGRSQRCVTEATAHLWGEHERLHELPHWLTVVGQLSHHLDDHAVAKRGVSVNLPDLRVALAELQ